MQNRRTPSPSVFDSHFKRKSGAEEDYERDEPHRGSAFDSPGLASVASYPGLGYGLWRTTPSVLRFFNFISFKRANGPKRTFFMRTTNPIGGSAFDSPRLASIASYPGLICCVGTQRRRCCASLISSLSIGKMTQRIFAELTNPIGVPLLIAQGWRA